MGERPVTASQRYGLSLDDLTARHIMTPVDAVEAVSMAEVSRAQVGHVVATLRASGRQHAIAVEHDSEGRQVVRGIFSSAQIARQLGVAVNTSEIALARNFAEIERAMAEA
jgi:DNA-binding CsgD family transcriptional regulator